MKKSLLRVTTMSLGAALILGVAVASVSTSANSLVRVNAASDAVNFTNGTYANSEITWTLDGVLTIKQSKGTSTTAVNSSYVSAPRWYKNHVITFTPSTGITISSLVFTTDSGYDDLTSGWSSGSTSSSGTTTTWTGSATSSFTCTLGAQGRPKALSVTYTSAAGEVVKTLASISVSGQTTEYVVGDTFAFDGTCTATYDTGATSKVTPIIAAPDMSTTGTKTVNVSYTESSVTKTTSYEINVAEDTYSKATFDLTKTPKTVSDDELTWETSPFSLSLAKNESATNTSNYYPGKPGTTYTSTRMYTNQTLTLDAAGSALITRIVFIATTENYASAAKNNTWTGATSRSAGNDVVVTPTSPTNHLTCTFGAAQGYTSIIVSYTDESTPEPSDKFSIVAPKEMDLYANSVPFEYENLPETYDLVASWVAVGPEADAVMSDDAEVDDPAALHPTITNLVESGEVIVYIHATVQVGTEFIVADPVRVAINYGLSNFAKDFKDMIGDECDPDGEITDKEVLEENWATVAEVVWPDLSNAEQETFRTVTPSATASTNTIEGAAALYDYVVSCGKYNVTDFASRGLSAYSRVIKSVLNEQSDVATVVAVAAVASISLVGALAVSKKRKEN